MRRRCFCGSPACPAFCADPAESQTEVAVLGLSAPVGEAKRCKNIRADVILVQKALNRFTPLEAGPSPKLAENGTLDAATSSALLYFQKRRFGIAGADGVVDPNGRTDRQLAGPADRYKSLPQQMMSRVPEARAIVSYALQTLATARDFQKAPLASRIVAQSLWGKLCIHFKIDKFSNPAKTIAWVERIYQNMMTAIVAIETGKIKFADASKNAYRGGYFYSQVGGFYSNKLNEYGAPQKSIYICPSAHRLDAVGFTYSFIHELAHFVGPPEFSLNLIDDFGYHHRPTATKPGYYKMTPWQSTHNADSFAQYAFDVSLGKFSMFAHIPPE